MEIQMVKVSDIVPYSKNPRINEKTVQKLVNLIPRVGFNVPLVLDRNNVIIKGHARLKAAKILGMEEVPCIYSDKADDINKFDRIADNKVHEFTTWDRENFAHEVDTLNTDFDLSSLGLQSSDFGDFEFNADFDDDVPTADDRRERYLEYVQSQQQPQMPTITPQAEIDKAKEKQSTFVKKPDELVAIKCSCCGEEFYVKKDSYVRF